MRHLRTLSTLHRLIALTRDEKSTMDGERCEVYMEKEAKKGEMP